MKTKLFVEAIANLGIEEVVGVPDSTLKEFCNYINSDEQNVLHHSVATNEGAAIALATGYYLASAKAACVYMQNSGLGNIVNPITSLANEAVYGIPMLLLVGWRGEPGVHDEPQHVFMGEITLGLLNIMNIHYAIISEKTTEKELEVIFKHASEELALNHQFAIVIKKNTFEAEKGMKQDNGYHMIREEAIAEILKHIKTSDVLVSTTGKISREVYEQANAILGQHSQSFLTVGGMGHASMIALAIAEKRQDKRVYCIDGDGAVLMHMGALALIAKKQLKNYVHICINNDAHESVGAMPTAAVGQNYSDIAKACNYKNVYSVSTLVELDEVLKLVAKQEALTFIEIKVALTARKDLGRPKESAQENKKMFMKYHGVE